MSRAKIVSVHSESDSYEEYIDILDPEEEIQHYGKGHEDGGHSGRYPWGSGDHPFQRDDFLGTVRSMRKTGMTDKEIADKLRITAKDRKGNDIPNINRLRIQVGLAEDYQRRKLVDQVERLRDEGLSTSEIGRRMGKNESTIRSLLNEESKKRMELSEGLAAFLKEKVDNASHGMIDVGKGINEELNVTTTAMDAALYILELDGYKIYGGGVRNRNNPGHQTNLKVLAKPDVEHKSIFNFEDIDSITDYQTNDDGKTFDPKFVEPAKIARNRVMIRYPKDGGSDLDGTIELRRGVQDLDLGASNYAQVRIAVDSGHFLKGMAIYSDAKDWPKGVDIVFNTSKPDGADDDTVFKPLKKDPTNPFGALLKPGVYDPNNPESNRYSGQSYYIDKKTGEKKLSVVNKTREEGDWEEWSKNIPSQFLAKQSKELIRRQLELTVADKMAKFDEINALTNPVVKQAELLEFANDCDKNAKTLKAVSLPGQKYQVILPVPELKPNECYAPNYPDGETLALIRYPHGGTFEIPIVKNNLHNSAAISRIGPQALDAIGIPPASAKRLSGADYDGDTVQAIPCNSAKSKVRVISTNPLKGLEGFVDQMDALYQYPKEDARIGELFSQYKKYKRKGLSDAQIAEKEGMSVEDLKKDIRTARKKGISILHKGKETQMEMGKASNLITDMTLGGASEDELARAVRHSMVVIDAAKHKLNYKLSYEENGIQELKEKYMAHVNENGNVSYGASTIISRAKAEATIDKRQGSGRINKETGEMEYKTSEEPYYWKKVKDAKSETGYKMVWTKKTEKSTQMDVAKDAFELVSNMSNPVEVMYANFANTMKDLANQARLASLKENVGSIHKNAEMAAEYAEEVESMKAKLHIANLNRPKERKAMMYANSELDKAIEAAEADDDELSKEDKKKKYQKFMVEGRAKYNADSKGSKIHLTDREWEAIQKGAITENFMRNIVDNMDKDELRERATPKGESIRISDAQIRKMKAYLASGYPISLIAEDMNLSTSTVRKYVKEGR